MHGRDGVMLGITSGTVRSSIRNVYVPSGSGGVMQLARGAPPQSLVQTPVRSSRHEACVLIQTVLPSRRVSQLAACSCVHELLKHSNPPTATSIG